jgi:hypothetical protein
MLAITTPNADSASPIMCITLRMFRSSEPFAAKPTARLMTMAAAATAIASRPSAGWGSRMRAMPSHAMKIAIKTRDTALASAAKMPTRW